nr:MAG TPA: hypothetical protein [Caudoviricetes sp.]
MRCGRAGEARTVTARPIWDWQGQSSYGLAGSVRTCLASCVKLS